jgi:hypothetical protein
MNVDWPELIIAFYPNARGFAYVILEGSCSPVDWGMSDLPRTGKTQQCRRRLSILLDRYKADALVLRKIRRRTHGDEGAEIIQVLTDLAKKRGIPTACISRKQIRKTFAHLGSPTRYAIVEAIAKHLPILHSFVPGRRKIWNGEDRRMGLFDAAALALTFLSQELGSRPTGSS